MKQTISIGDRLTVYLQTKRTAQHGWILGIIATLDSKEIYHGLCFHDKWDNVVKDIEKIQLTIANKQELILNHPQLLQVVVPTNVVAA